MICIKAECIDCDGTGLYEGFCERKGHPVICTTCAGTGCQNLYYTPFVKRKVKKGVKGVSLSQGRFIVTGVGATGEEISYPDFIEGKLEYQK